MARFLFIWMIMIGAMVGVRDGTHFDVDLWPELDAARQRRCCSIVSNVFVLVFALVFVWYGIQFVQFGWDQNSELAELPMASSSSPGRSPASPGCCSSASASSPTCARWPRSGASDGRRRRADAGDRRADPVRHVLHADGAARADRLRARARLPAGDVHRAAAVADDPVQRDLQVLQLVHPAGGAVLPADRQPDERRRHHRPAGAAVARPGRPLSRAAWRRSTSCCRSSSPASPARRPPTPRARARSSSRRRSRKATTCRSRWRSPRCRRCWR